MSFAAGITRVAMNKLDLKFLEEKNGLENCFRNEFVVLPIYGDVGFDEYFEYKAINFYNTRKIIAPFEKTRLTLAYPPPLPEGLVTGEINNAFMRFFESPAVVARTHEFEGCFAIDVSEYLGKEDHINMVSLMSFIRKTNDKTAYVLFVNSNNTNQIEAMYHELLQYNKFDKTILSLPSADKLAEYVADKIREMNPHVGNSIVNYLKKYFSKNPLGYDFADFLSESLKDENYRGDLPALKEILKNISLDDWTNGQTDSFGY